MAVEPLSWGAHHLFLHGVITRLVRVIPAISGLSLDCPDKPGNDDETKTSAEGKRRARGFLPVLDCLDQPGEDGGTETSAGGKRRARHFLPASHILDRTSP